MVVCHYFDLFLKFSQLLLDALAPHPILKDEPSRLVEEAHFERLHLQTYCLGRY